MLSGDAVPKGGDGGRGGGGEGEVASSMSSTQLPDRSKSSEDGRTSQAQETAAGASVQTLTGKQEHYLKREMLSQQVKTEISELASTTAFKRFGAPFKSEYGEVAPVDSDFPILRYIFCHFVRNFPFLDQAREKEFWQDKLQVFLESFASKHISSSEDRLEETKRRKLAMKAHKLVELMMVSGIPTASGYEERIRFSEMEVVDRGANEQGLLVNVPEGNFINGWDVNVAGVRTVSVKRTVRYHQHAEFILRVTQPGKDPILVGRRYGQFAKLHKRLRLELPGKVLAPLPRKNKSSTTSTFLRVGGDDDDSSVSSVSTQATGALSIEDSGSLRQLVAKGHGRSASTHSAASNRSGRVSEEYVGRSVTLYREDQRVSLRAFLRTYLQNKQIAGSKAMLEFLTTDPVHLNEEESNDLKRRRDMDEKRIEEQQKFYEIARQRARELDVYMEKFRRDIVERNGLRKLFAEIKEKSTIADLSVEYQKFVEWLRIEVAATIYHLFLAEDNSPEMHAQARRIHSMIPYVPLKQVIRFANPALVMSGVLDLFLAQPFGTRSLAQRVFGLAINDSIKTFQKSIGTLTTKIDDPVLCQKLQAFCESPEDLKDEIRLEAANEDIDIVVAILRSDKISLELQPEQFEKIFNAYVAWNHTVSHVDAEMKHGAVLFSQLKQLLKMYTRQRDKSQMLSIIEEPVTLRLFRDLFTIFYEPLVRVYKSANVYNSVTDFAAFADDTFSVLDTAQRQDISADPNQTVQAFIDLCTRHQENLYKFIHEVHVHDNGLFTALMTWIEDILEFLRHGPKGGKLDMNALFQGAVDMKQINKDAAIAEINALIKWQEERKKWHQAKTRQKMAAEGTLPTKIPTTDTNGITGADFGLHEDDLADLAQDFESDSDDLDSDDDNEQQNDGTTNDSNTLDPSIIRERKRRAKQAKATAVKLRRTAGEPVKPEVKELDGLREGFVSMLRMVLAE